ncbi:MAG: signal peptidase [Gemmataceae bacterium]|nr:signal peptidase [Gemmataceae bacterium]
MNRIIRHGVMRLLGEFTPNPPDLNYARGQEVIVQTERGLEIGEVLCEATPAAVAYLAEPTRGQILRVMTAEDYAERDRIHQREEVAFRCCNDFIRQRHLQMDLLDVEQLFGGERIIFYFFAEKRVDFRELVKDLAREFRTRIELRQVGVRDEAKLLADYGDCGKPVCCNTHMTVMPPVSMRMAKLQKATLDPFKISGRCGRLKCCLRFEHEVYEEFQKQLPPPGAQVVTSKGRGRVLAQEILARKVLVECEDGRRVTITANEVLAILNNSK